MRRLLGRAFALVAKTWMPGIAGLWLVLSLAAAWGAPEPEDIEFKATCDGSPERYVLLRPEGFDAEQPVDVLVCLHGHGSDRWQCVKGAYEEFRAAREAAAQHKMLFVSPDYRARTSWMGPQAEADTLQILDELAENFRLRHVLFCGASMGGSSVLTFAALHPDRVDGVVSLNGTANHVEYDQFQDAIAASFGGTKTEVPEEYRRRSAEFFAERLTMPVGIGAGGQDKLVPPQSVVRLGRALEKRGAPVKLLYREQGGHSTTFSDSHELLEFVIERLGQDSSANR